MTAQIVRREISEQGRWVTRKVVRWEIVRSDGASGGLYETRKAAVDMCETLGLEVIA